MPIFRDGIPRDLSACLYIREMSWYLLTAVTIQEEFQNQTTIKTVVLHSITFYYLL